MTNNKQQTIVEWIEQEMLKPNLSMKELLEKAKEMEKERMIGFTNKYINSELWVNCNAIESDSTVEQYYNETYGNNNE
jgi:predicted nucleic acid-binding protein